MSNIGNKETMSKNLKYYIERSGKDRKTLAAIWGFPYSTVTDWINGNKYPRIDRIEVMADYFGIQKSDLIEDKKEQPIVNDGLSENMNELIKHLKTLPDDKIQMLLQVARSIK
jgi:repressor LexA